MQNWHWGVNFLFQKDTIRPEQQRPACRAAAGGE